MPQQVATTVENNFTKGLITEATGLNFPENAATDTDNCEYTLIGDVVRRVGINNEVGFATNTADRTNAAVNSYKWNNAGGDGLSQIIVVQVGSNLYFYLSSAANAGSPVSTQILSSTVSLNTFLVAGSSNIAAGSECQFADGNGSLFVFNPSCEPFYCTFANGLVTATQINIKTRDFTGIFEAQDVNFRPVSSSNEHLYNLLNQGWVSAPAWSATSGSSVTVGLGSKTFTIASGLSISNGDLCNIIVLGQTAMAGAVTSYVGTSLTINVTSDYSFYVGDTFASWTIYSLTHGFINTWVTAVGNNPSNADVWWTFKDTSNVFNPTVTLNEVTLGTGPAPKGHFLLNAFNLDRGLASGVSGLTAVSTVQRPTNGAWFQGRVWYTGVSDSRAAVGDALYYTWTENIYFSQIITDTSQFGNCYQQNDPTSETLFDLLPTDGGVITIQGCGPIYKLFSMQNALLIFAANGVWYLTGNQGIGFAANDYTIVKLSSVRSISCTSFVNVQGLPYFWNEEGIYSVEPAKQGTSLLNSPLHVNPLEVAPITLGTILTFYNSIPLSSKQNARGDYDPVEYIIKWAYRDTEAPDVTGRYTFNKILNFNTSNKAFFPYTVDTSSNSINGLVYVASPGGVGSTDATIKFIASKGTAVTFADEHDTNYVDWGNVNYVSYFVTGYKIRGQGIKKFQPQYIQVYCKTNGAFSAYKIQGLWDYSNNRNSGRWSSIQLINNALTNYATISRRHKIRGHGFALQFKVISSDGVPFDIQGWAVVDAVNQGT